jgi:exopolysaccharide production protein ExoZ
VPAGSQTRARVLDAAGRDTRLKFGGIEAARGIAAVLVAAYHGSRLVAQPRYAGVIPAGGMFGDFDKGVDFFFVLSGFLITWVHWNDVGRPSRLRHYLSRRFIRIYPVYWLALLFPLAGSALHVRESAVPLTVDLVVSSIFLLPGKQQPVLGVAWTLVYEVLFYGAFACAILTGRRAAACAAAVWAALIMAVSILGISAPFPSSFLASPFILEFLMGVAVAILLRRISVSSPRALAMGGAALFVVFMLARIDRFVSVGELGPRLFFGPCAAAFVAGSVEWERSGPTSVPRWLGLLGGASYSIYLIHSTVEPIVMRAVWSYIRTVSPLIITVGLTCVGTLAGTVFHLAVEKPVLRYARRIFGASDHGAGGRRPDGA